METSYNIKLYDHLLIQKSLDVFSFVYKNGLHML